MKRRMKKTTWNTYGTSEVDGMSLKHQIRFNVTGWECRILNAGMPSHLRSPYPVTDRDGEARFAAAKER